MSELRKDPVGGQWVIIASERAARPHEFRVQKPRASGGFCPFCEGNESRTPPEILAYREPGSEANGPGWRVRVVPNKYPALIGEGGPKRKRAGVYERMRGVGAHEIIIECPNHVASIAALSLGQMTEVILAYRQRIVELMKDERLSYAQLFKNVGAAAGASLEHSHSQLVCTPVVPRRIQEEMSNFRRFQDRHGRCPLCDIVAQELQEGERVLQDTDGFVCLAPFASRFPFEMWVVPKRHEARFEEIEQDRARQLAGVLQEAVRDMERCLGNPPYNYAIHTSPFPGRRRTSSKSDLYHWHVEIIPRLTYLAGFEWGTGFYINPLKPEEAARFLREAAREGIAAGASLVSYNDSSAAGD